MHTTSLAQFADYPTGDRERIWARSADPASQQRPSAADDGDPATELGFWDLVDVINPFQHIPLINYAYREITGDEISNPARVLGGTLYGGPLGLLAGVGQSMLVESTGRDAGEHVVAYLFGEADDPAGGLDGGETESVVASRPDAASTHPAEPDMQNGKAELPAGTPAAEEGARALETLKLSLGAPASPMPPSGVPMSAQGAEGVEGEQIPAPARVTDPVAPFPTSPVGAPIEADSRLDAALAALAASSTPGETANPPVASPSLLSGSETGGDLFRQQALARYRQSAGLAAAGG